MVDEPQQSLRAPELAVELNRGLQGSCRALEIPGPEASEPEPEAEVGEARLLLDRLLEIRHRPTRLAAFQSSAGGEQPRFDVARVEAQSLIELAQGGGRLAQLEQRNCEPEAPVGEAGLRLRRAAHALESR